MTDKLKKLNLGCGPKWKEQFPDYEGLDIIDYGQQHVGNVEKLLPNLEPESYGEVVANHFLEHFDQDQLRGIFRGIWEVLVGGGLLKFVVPHKDMDRAWCLTHKTFWNESTVKWLGRKEAVAYGFGNWRLENVIVNERPDIHTWLRKVGKDDK